VSENATTERVSPTVETAQTEVSKVADTAAQQARVVTREAGEQARSAVDRVQCDLRERADEEARKLARTLHETSHELQAMARAGESEASMLATLSQEGARAAERLASRLEQGADTVVADVRSWARRNPGGFLFGAAVGGFLIGRVVRNRPSNGSVRPGPEDQTNAEPSSPGRPAGPMNGVIA
jgi:hypothetical protein